MMEYHDVNEMIDFAERVIGDGTEFDCDARPLGWRRDGALIAVAVFHRFSPWDCEVAFAVAGRRWFDPAFAIAGLAYPFLQLKLERLTCEVGADNRAARALARWLGFAPEGRKRRLGGADRLIYGLLRSECRFLAPMARAA